MLRNSIFLLLFLIFLGTKSQDIRVYNNYIYNNFYNTNPAAAGYDGSFVSQISVTKKWIGIKDSPSTQLFSNSLRLGDEEFYDPNKFVNRPIINMAPRVGLGFSIFNESSGPLRHTGILFAYAYHLSFRENRLSFGLSGLITQYHLNTEEFKPINSNDPVLYYNTSAIVPDINFGALYYNRNMFAGISANSLMNFNNVMDHTKTNPDIMICVGRKFILNYNLKFEPSFFIWRDGHGGFSADINTKLYYRENNWLLLSYQGFGELIAGIGLKITTNIQFCYYYAVNTNGLASYNYGSQSISVKADITGLIRRHK
jgi:type IX secretion system PorP/SprF family membrane protein